MDDKIVGKLIESLKNDFTIEETCAYAGINKSTYYDWLKKYPNFSDEMEAAKFFVAMETKKTASLPLPAKPLSKTSLYLSFSRCWATAIFNPL